MRFSGKTMAYALAAILVLAAAAVSAAGLDRPYLSTLKGQFEYMRAWGEFGISLEGSVPTGASRYVAAIVRGSSGASASQAVWDGSTVQYDDKGTSWSIPLDFKVNTDTEKASIASSWSAGTTFPWGVASLSISPSSAAKTALSASFGVIGSEAVDFKDGSYAVMKSSARESDGLFQYLLIKAASPATALKVTTMRKGSMTASLATFQAGFGVPSPLVGEQGVEITLVKAVSDEDAASLAKAWVASSLKPEGKRPDVRLTGMVDKPKVVPGDVVRYTYYLFNAGMDTATGLSVAVPVPAGGKLVAESLSGDGGRVTLKPSNVVVGLEKAEAATSSAYESATEMIWNPSGSLKPGGVMKFSFDFLVK